MKFKVTVTCRRCTCRFELCPMTIKHRKERECPNCGQPLSQSDNHELEQGIIALGSLDGGAESHDSALGVPSENGFSFSLAF